MLYPSAEAHSGLNEALKTELFAIIVKNFILTLFIIFLKSSIADVCMGLVYISNPF